MESVYWVLGGLVAVVGLIVFVNRKSAQVDCEHGTCLPPTPPEPIVRTTARKGASRRARK